MSARRSTARAALVSGFVLGALLLAAQSVCAARHGDLGNGEYANPVLFADYSDPDVIRVGKEYYLVASSFSFMPGIPILKSPDLVNWTILGHVFPRLDIDPKYDMIGGNRYGRGAWAPAIRYHDGLFYVYFPTPDEGIFMSTAKTPAGPWTKPLAVISQSHLEDPCPFWDDDGKAYLIHSRTGAGPLILHRMSPDGKSVLDAGRVIVDNPQELRNLEGPKLYKRHGYYYIFAPFGGVSRGSQAVLRAKNIYGPYQFRTVLEQGATGVNGPHQGGYVETPDGQGWFLHFHSDGAYGRIDYLEPVKWVDDWPVIGQPIPGNDEAGEPVSTFKKPEVGGSFPIEFPQTSDEFSGRKLGPQWEWNHNPVDAAWSLTARPGYLRLKALPAPDLLAARNTLTEMMQDGAFDLTIRMDTAGMRDGERAGLAMFSNRPSWIGVEREGGRRQLVFSAQDVTAPGPPLNPGPVQLRVHVEQQTATFSYSINGGKSFRGLGQPSAIYFSWWKAARPAIFNFNDGGDPKSPGFVDVDWVHYQPAPGQR